MIYILINDQSFVGQAADEKQAAVLMRELNRALAALRTRLGSASVHRPRSIKDALLTSTLRLGAFLSATSSLSKDERMLALTLITKGPYLDDSTGSTLLIRL